MTAPKSIAKYVIQRPIRQGGMGAVYLASDPELERLVAVKLLRDDVADDESRERFVREARAVAGLRHPHIITVHDFGVHEGQPYLVMEFIPGETLAEIIARRAPIGLANRLQMIEELCAAVAYAHRMHIVHRDIKPGNIMLDAQEVIKVLDFGIAHTPESELTKAGVMLGTLSYMAPELLRGGPVDYRADIFAVGAVLYELMTFERAFGSDVHGDAILKILHDHPRPSPIFHSDLDSEFARIVDHALAKDPRQRYQDLALLRRDVARLREAVERSQGDSTEPNMASPVSQSGPTPASTGFRWSTIGTSIGARRISRQLARRGVAGMAVVLGSISMWLPGSGVSDRVLPPIPSVAQHSVLPTVSVASELAIASASPMWRSSTRLSLAIPPIGHSQTADRGSAAPTTVDASRSSEPASSVVQSTEPATPDGAEAAAAQAGITERIDADGNRNIAREAVGPNARPESTAPLPEVARGPTDAELIEQALQKYAAAMSARDADALTRVVAMDNAARGRQQNAFDQYDSLSMKLRVLRGPQIADGKATVRCRAEELVGLVGRAKRSRSSTVDITLAKTDGQWVVRSVRESR